MKSTLPLLLSILLAPMAVQSQSGYDYLDGNNVKALISPVGNHFWDYAERKFFIPKDSTTGTAFAFTTWIGGKKNDTLHVAAERFRQSGADYLPGPIGDISTYEPSEYAKWDRVWKITREEVQIWLSNPSVNPVPQSVIDWPVHGDLSVGQAQYLTPFVDVNGDGQYNPTDDFDYPVFKGDQAVYFMFHDGWMDPH